MNECIMFHTGNRLNLHSSRTSNLKSLVLEFVDCEFSCITSGWRHVHLERRVGDVLVIELH